MARAITGKRSQIPDGMEPLEWASAVWQAMDDFGFSQDEAKKYVFAAWSVEAPGVKAETKPPRDKAMESPMDNRIGSK
jgi:hypothetical protein